MALAGSADAKAGSRIDSAEDFADRSSSDTDGLGRRLADVFSVNVALASEAIDPVEVEAVIVELADPDEPPKSLDTIDLRLDDLLIVPASVNSLRYVFRTRRIASQTNPLKERQTRLSGL